MLPLLIAAAALLLVSGKKKKSSSSGGSDDVGLLEGVISATTATGADVGNPWEICPRPTGSSRKTFAAYGLDGECMVFWDDNTWGVARNHIDSELAKLTPEKRAKICELGECVPDLYTLDPDLSACQWVSTPEAIELVRAVVISMYPQLAETQLPPPESSNKMRYFPGLVWQLVWAEMQKHHCGYKPVT